MVQLMPLLHCPVISASLILEWFTVLVPAYPGCPGKDAIKWMSANEQNACMSFFDDAYFSDFFHFV